MDDLRRRVEQILSTMAMAAVQHAVSDATELIRSTGVVPTEVLTAASDLLEQHGLISAHGFVSSGRFQSTLIDAGDGSGDQILILPDELLQEMGCREGAAQYAALNGANVQSDQLLNALDECV